MRRCVAVAAIAMLAACGSSAGTAAPTSVSVQSSDLPSGLQKCAGSGDMDSFLNVVKSKDPKTYQRTSTEWTSAKSHGATAAQVVFYSDGKAHCAGIENATTDLTGATYPVVLNFVIQFKDSSTAARGYSSESIFGFSQALISSAGSGVVQGSSTGLGKNSITWSLAVEKQSIFVAEWQNGAYMVILGVLNIDSGKSKQIATGENSRIQ